MIAPPLRQQHESVGSICSRTRRWLELRLRQTCRRPIDPLMGLLGPASSQTCLASVPIAMRQTLLSSPSGTSTRTTAQARGRKVIHWLAFGKQLRTADSCEVTGPSTTDKAMHQMEAGSATVGNFLSSSYKQVTSAGQGIGTSVGIGMQQCVPWFFFPTDASLIRPGHIMPKTAHCSVVGRQWRSCFDAHLRAFQDTCAHRPLLPRCRAAAGFPRCQPPA